MTFVKKIQSENLAREWESDPCAPELWHSLQKMEVDESTGVDSLKKLAEAGSSLAMMRLGHIFLSGEFGVKEDADAGEDWMRRSAEAGSIEGGYRLANRLLATDRTKESMELFETLSNKGYAPATFVLGLENYRGHYIRTDIPKAIEYLHLAAARGHLPAKHWLSFILMKRGQGFLRWLRGFFIRISMIFPMVRVKLNRPGSDRLRIWA